jgi:hypothetical protein
MNKRCRGEGRELIEFSSCEETKMALLEENKNEGLFN